MNNLRILLGAITIFAVGCSSGTTVTSKIPTGPKKSPTSLTFINLTNEAVDVQVDKVPMVAALNPGEMSPGIMSGPKNHKIATSIGGASVEATVMGESASFTTIILRSAGGKGTITSLKGSSCVSPDLGCKVEFINLTAKPLNFSLDTEKASVEPNGFSIHDVSEGQKSVAIKGAPTANFSAQEKETWGVCCFEKDGKLMSTSVRLKGPLQPNVGRGSAKM